MRLVIQEKKNDVAEYAAGYVMNKIKEHEEKNTGTLFLMGLPTGSTPEGMYKKLIELHQDPANEFSFKNVVTFNMDEYVFPSGTTPCAKNPNSYHYYMWNAFFQHIDILPENVHILDGDVADMDELAKECEKYERIIKGYKKKIDIFIGGIGPDGHVAFNEPGSSLKSRTRVKTLNYETMLANTKHMAAVEWDPEAEDPISKVLNAKNRGPRYSHNNGDTSERKVVPDKGFFVPTKRGNAPSVPRTALTVGVGTVMDAHEVMILVTGQPKALALSKCIEEGVSHQWTVSMVQLHEKALVVCDKPATSEMRVKTVDYYQNLYSLHMQAVEGAFESGYESEVAQEVTPAESSKAKGVMPPPAKKKAPKQVEADNTGKLLGAVGLGFALGLGAMFICKK